ncbi:hypothetical protein [Roseisolibacter agri]|uniref:Uncharacterized protein n=1 Tax=Roseisolibacter agri TaxID=2014610 RepID=A0AA37Q2P4_9BACT|nr:hypothetical protein [Roseisolibacter agri]GLC25284.1 hypothetical protein rosag_17970 [Roseisolibacter agri]
MPNASSPSPSHRAALAALILDAKTALHSEAGRARYPDTQWSDEMWSMPVPGEAPFGAYFGQRSIADNRFTRNRWGAPGRNDFAADAWPADFGDPIRAYLLLGASHSRDHGSGVLYAVRRLWDFLLASDRAGAGRKWTWDLLDDATLASFHTYLRGAKPAGAALSSASAVLVLTEVADVAAMLVERGACAPLSYSPRRTEREAREATARASLVLPPEATGLARGDQDPRWVNGAAALVRDARLRWDTAPEVRARWAPAPWDGVLWTLRDGTARCVWSADFLPQRLERTPQVLEAYGLTLFPPSYADPLRAYLVERDGLAAASLNSYLSHWRLFYRFLSDAGLSTAESPWHWSMATDEQLVGYAAYLRAGHGSVRRKEASAKQAINRVAEIRIICDWLAIRAAGPAITLVAGDGELRSRGTASAAGTRAWPAPVRPLRPERATAGVQVSPPEAAPRVSLEPKLERVVEKGSRRLATEALRVRHPGAAWDDSSWPLAAPDRTHTLVFGHRPRVADREAQGAGADGVVPWPAWYGDPLRAMVTERTQMGALGVQGLLSGARAFWRFLEESRLTTAETPWSWSRLDDRVLGRYETYLRTQRERTGVELEDTSIRAKLDIMLTIGRWLARHRVVRTPTYVPVSASATARWRDEDEQRQAGAALLPPRGSLEALARLYYEVTRGALRGKLTAGDEACVLILVLLMLTGRRLVELLRLHADCLLYETVRPWRDGWGATEGVLQSERPQVVGPDQKIVLRMRYWMAKKRSVREGVIGVMPTAAPVVESCIRRLRELSAGPRARAAELQATPDDFPLPAVLAGKPYLTSEDLVTIYPLRKAAAAAAGGMGERHSGTPVRLRNVGLQVARTNPGGARFLAADVAAAMQALRRRLCPSDVVMQPASGPPQMLSETLLLTYEREGYRDLSTGVAVPPVTSLVRRISHGMVYGRVAGPKSGLWRDVRRLAPELEVKGLRSHGFRRWLNSVAVHGGAPIAVLTRYFGRDQDDQTKAYIYPADLLDLPAEALAQDARARAAHLRHEVKAGRVYSSVALGYFRVKAAEGEAAADAFLERNLPVAHPTEMGHCARDLAVEPCQKHLNCLDGCEHYVGTKGDVREVRALSDLAERLAQEGDMLRARLAAGVRIHGGRLPRSERQLAEVRALLRWHHDPSIPDGTTITKDGPVPRRLRVLT